MVIGPIISLDDWVPERPPKNPSLRIPSPDLPPPPPSAHVANDKLADDEPLPPPPPELLRHVRQLSEPDTKPLPPSRRNSFAGQTNNKKYPYRPATDVPSPLATPLPASPQSSPPPAIPKKSTGPFPPPTDFRPPIAIPIQQQQPHPQYTSYAQSAQPQRPVSGMSTKYPHYPPAVPTSMHSKLMQHHHLEHPAPDATGATDRHSENARVTMRKRSHNAQLTPVEMPPVNAKLMPAHNGQLVGPQQPPPPLKPRLMPVIAGGIGTSSSGSSEANGSRPMSSAGAGRQR